MVSTNAAKRDGLLRFVNIVYIGFVGKSSVVTTTCKQQEKEDKPTAGKKRDWNDIEQLFEKGGAEESQQKKNEMEMRANEEHRT